jgi:hypothetical protein
VEVAEDDEESDYDVEELYQIQAKFAEFDAIK